MWPLSSHRRSSSGRTGCGCISPSPSSSAAFLLLLWLLCLPLYCQAFLLPKQLPCQAHPHGGRARASPPLLLAATTTVFTPALQPSERDKENRAADGLFYSYPRLCTHVDDNFISQLTDLYRKEIPVGGAVLDLMSSWISHLPEVEYSRVDGHGLNMEELMANPRLNRRVIQDLNKNATLPFDDNSYDAVLIACSIQYLQQAEKVMQEIHRVLKPQGKVIISFSNRMFWDKAINGWTSRGDIGRIRLVSDYISSVSYVGATKAPGFLQPPAVVTSEVGVAPTANVFERFMGAMLRARPAAQDPFFVVIGQKLPPPPQGL